jgi:hypothetical protein
VDAGSVGQVGEPRPSCSTQGSPCSWDSRAWQEHSRQRSSACRAHTTGQHFRQCGRWRGSSSSSSRWQWRV